MLKFCLLFIIISVKELRRTDIDTQEVTDNKTFLKVSQIHWVWEITIDWLHIIREDLTHVAHYNIMHGHIIPTDV